LPRLVKSLLDLLEMRSANSSHGAQVPFLEEKEAGNQLDSISSQKILGLICVDLKEGDVFVLTSKMLNLRSDLFAGLTPVGTEINKDVVMRRCLHDDLIELFTRDRVNGHFQKK